MDESNNKGLAYFPPTTGSAALAGLARDSHLDPSHVSDALRQGGHTALAAGPDLGLHHAVATGDMGSIYYALMGGQPIDSVLRGLQAIHIAASQEDPAVVEMLLQSGADINARSHSLQSIGHSQPEFLGEDRTDEPSKAKAGGRTQRGAKGWSGRAYPKESVLSNISSPLNCTAGLYSMEAANTGAPVEHPTSLGGHGTDRAGGTCSEYGGATPLHFAVANGRLECADILIRSGANLDIADYYGNTPEALALARSDSIIAAMLQRGRESTASSLSLGFSETSGLASLVAYPYDPAVSCYSSLAPQLPSPNPSVVCYGDCSPTTEQPLPVTNPRTPEIVSATSSKAAVPAFSRLTKGRRQEAWQPTRRTGVPARRHTAGEAESITRHAYVSPSPTAPSWLKTKHRGTSPIGIRSLSASTGQHCRLGRSASASGRLVNKERGDSPRRAVADSPPLTGFVRHMANLRDVSHTGTAGPYGSRRLDGYGRRARFAAAGMASGMPLDEPENFGSSNGCALSRSDSASSRRERSYTDSVVEKAWRSYLEYDEGGDTAHDFAASNASLEDGGLRPVPEPWMWKQAAMAVRNRRSQSLSAKAQQTSLGPAPVRRKRPGRLL
ncbi:hypothetical protein IWW39_005797 [Coemansia spiralis]|uniref:Ankyrin n=1 Tax=Coemansia spiralis TaxID=417178 RepID=A0A9W8GA79_9FUNG|nr:hypothetical protein IWW39_005797 [Coemansia spiralis]